MNILWRNSVRDVHNPGLRTYIENHAFHDTDEVIAHSKIGHQCNDAAWIQTHCKSPRKFGLPQFGQRRKSTKKGGHRQAERFACATASAAL